MTFYDLNMNSKRINNCQDPSGNQDVATKGYVDTSFLKSKLIVSTRDLTASSGNVSYTGAGFTPRSVIIFGSLNFVAVASWGMSDNSRTVGAIHTTGGGANFYSSNVAVYFETSSNNGQYATVASYDADGFTLTWTKNNSPTGTATLYMLCLR